MSAQTMKRVYGPFFTTKEAFGTGLGLWVSAGIVEKHGGRLRVRSRQTPGRCGTVFTVYFPYGGALDKGLDGQAAARSKNVDEEL
jgi:signal transduction histidine kinase